MNRTHAALLVAMCGLLPAMPAAAATATPIFMPTTITASGTYQLVKNIGPGATHVIDILGTGLEDIVIDLNGFTVTTSGGLDGIRAVNVRTLTIRNGTISDPGSPGGAGIYVMSATSVNVDAVTMLGLDKGVHLDAVVSFDVARCKILGSATYGIEVDGTGATAVVQGKIHENTVRDALQGGIYVHDNHTNVEVVQNNVAQSTNGIGIHLLGGTSCIVYQNRARGNLTGIQLDAIQWCNITTNTVAENTGDGIVLAAADSVYVDHNISARNVGSGLVVGGDQNIILVNRLTANDGLGMWFEPPADNNFYQDNTARNNAGTTPTGGVCPAPACPGLSSPDYCDDGASNTSGGGNWMPGAPAC